jgi:hypothetical protein
MPDFTVPCPKTSQGRGEGQLWLGKLWGGGFCAFGSVHIVAVIAFGPSACSLPCPDVGVVIDFVVLMDMHTPWSEGGM